MAALTRLFAYAREHQEQARTNGNELRAEQWNSILDKLIDRSTLAKLIKGRAPTQPRAESAPRKLGSDRS